MPNVNSPPSGFIESALAGVMHSAPVLAAGDTYNAAAGVVSGTIDAGKGVYAGLKFLADPPRVAVTVIGFLLIAGGIFMLGRNQIIQMVKP